jgi:hypothetical protein
VNPIQQVKAGNKKSKPAQAAEDFAKKITNGTGDRPGRYNRSLAKDEGFGQQNAPANCSFPKKRPRVIKPEKYKDSLAIKKAMLV